MHRLLISHSLLSEESPTLPADASRHLRVIRPQQGEKIELFDGRGCSRLYAWRGDGLVAEGALEQEDAPSVSLTLFACVTKGSRWDWTIEKATELGVSRIVPVISERTIVRLAKGERGAKRERWLRIAEDAARQCDARWIPEICEAVDFRDALTLVKETTCFIGALTVPPSPHLMNSLVGVSARSLATFIGPEGDFTPDELGALMQVAHPVSFGPTVLRAETAALFALSLLSAVRATVKSKCEVEV